MISWCILLFVLLGFWYSDHLANLSKDPEGAIICYKTLRKELHKFQRHRKVSLSYLNPSSYRIVHWIQISTSWRMIRWYKNVRSTLISLTEVNVLKKNILCFNSKKKKTEMISYFNLIKLKKRQNADLTERIIKICWWTVGVCKVNRILFWEKRLLGSRKR